MRQSSPFLPSLLSLCLLSLTACGGGGGSDKSASADVKSSVQSSQASSQASSAANNPDFNAIVGLYDASITTNNIKDESYLYISGSGKVTAYNYMGDSKDLGNNCYREAAGTDINVGLTGKALIYSAAKAEYTTDIDGKSVAWVLGTDNQISKVVYAGSISASRISMSVSGASLVVDSKKITSLSIGDITAALCK